MFIAKKGVLKFMAKDSEGKDVDEVVLAPFHYGRAFFPSTF